MPGLVATIHIVDDDEAVRFALRMLVESCGWQARVYGSAAEYLGAPLPAAGPACLVLDLDMPGMNGVELLQQLTAERRALPTVVITGFADSPLAARARHAGVRTLLKKPFGDQSFVESVRAALGAGREATPARDT